jgi:hypothetical protein
MTSTPETPDAVLLEAHDLARAALLEVTPEASIGEPAGYSVEEEGLVSLRFENRLAGYPGWFWTVSVARVEGSEPTVLEVELLPGETALLAPEWVPWAVRLAEYQAAQAAVAEASEGDADEASVDDDLDDDESDDEDDDEDLDAADFSSDGSPILHAGDLDGVDIDELDPHAADADDDEDDADEDDADEDDSDDDDSDDNSDDDSDDDEPFDDDERERAY